MLPRLLGGGASSLVVADFTESPSANWTVARDGEGQADEPSVLVSKLAGLSEAERELVLLELVLKKAAITLGHDTPREIGPEDDFMDMGLTSPSAIELRNQPAGRLGCRCRPAPSTTFRTPSHLAVYLREELAGSSSVAESMTSRR